MKIKEAIEKAKEGFSVARKSWNKERFMITFKDQLSIAERQNSELPYDFGILLSDTLYIDNPSDKVLFVDLLKRLFNGEKVRSSSPEALQSNYIYYDKETDKIMQSTLKGVKYSPCVDDLKANDWEIINDDE